MTGRWVRAVAALAVAASLMPGCARLRRDKAEAELLTTEALYQRALSHLEHRRLREARSDLERIQFTAENRVTLEPLVRLALADATFYAGDELSLIEARSKYLDFVTLYADHPMAPYAQFQAGVSSLRQVNDPSRDQSQTHEAIADLRVVEERWPGSPFAGASGGMIRQAQDNIAEHEYLVARFYFRRRAWGAAADRLRGLLQRYPAYSEQERVYLLLGQALVLGGSDAEGRIYLDKLVAEHPDSEAAEEAKKFLADLPQVARG
jgi:outer membrane assembly lipoprotein YfiO